MSFTKATDIDHCIAVESITPSPSPSAISNALEQASCLGFVLIFVMIISFYLGRWSQNRHEEQVINYQQRQIQRLEKIWKMATHQKP